MAEKPEIDPRIFQTVPTFSRAQDYKTIYTNMVRTFSGPYDIRVVLSQIVDAQPGTVAVHVEDLVTVIMSPSESKAVLQALQAAIEKYESLYGDITDVGPIVEKMRADALKKIAGTETTEKTKN